MRTPFIRPLFFLIALGLLVSAPVFSAHAADKVGDSCSSLGTTTIAADRANLIACMLKTASAATDATCDNAGGCVWKSMTGGSAPTGTLAFFTLAACPDGWAMADGTNGTLDVRGEFLRVWDGGKGIDTGRTLGSRQGDAIRNITGGLGYVTGGWFGWSNYGVETSGAFQSEGVRGYLNTVPHDNTPVFSAKFDASKVVPTSNENRPRNIALIACQKI